MPDICKKCLLRDSFPADYEKYVDALLRRMSETQKAAKEIYDSRLAQCKACDQLNIGTCMGCGCLVELKAAYKNEKCPYKKW